MRKHWGLVLLVLLFPSLSSALIIDSWHQVADLSEDTVMETIDLRFEANKTEPATFIFPPRLIGLEVLLDEKPTTCTSKEKVGQTEVRCELPAGKHFMSISYKTSYPLLKLEEKLLFKTTLDVPAQAKEFFYEVKLPLGFIIPKGKESAFVSPKPRFVYSDGQRIILVWKKTGLEEPFEASVLSTPLSKPMPFWPIALGIAAVIIGAVIAYLVFLRKQPKELVVPELIDAEQIVVSILKKAKQHQLWQKQILIASKLSKAKLSRTLRNLEQRGVIKKEPFGNTNKITLVTKEESPKAENN
jgi:uncharacterized membrane protein